MLSGICKMSRHFDNLNQTWNSAIVKVDQTILPSYEKKKKEKRNEVVYRETSSEDQLSFLRPSICPGRTNQKKYLNDDSRDCLGPCFCCSLLYCLWNTPRAMIKKKKKNHYLYMLKKMLFTKCF